MEQVLCEPVELTEFELDAVAGGNPFSSLATGAFGLAQTNNSGSFAIGAVSGDFSSFAFSVNTGQAAITGPNIA
jgi:hypothetical protein